ncbi:alanine/ornithine racemase family PLP-dependent enzyme [Mangrovimonas sp. AS39]|uniref:alanine racemase n=1 Tax=Mangrovimonas TaxID=1211036 RepID=UPI001421F922|nr:MULTISPECIES: alanine/ornithine racemase family PLP-dependent enzyme [Mangrovimonas]MCF1192939.1 alanine/ornithine racemase family PLP-dependent enzyme [Mangrovimonas futianensis]MCF1196630.1 alanine/ornithine racemase family PLP-dependent enzyme [Mangrovimonas futianensis]MCF1421595.1 alanine/ornithine racemase family PLP-dependent enzyme [Mangrovimonas futianensis]NIK93498.1 alanine/ornithine racemase family PLP-dependent enzyme [Mangrovimonas sp. CR14]
MAYFTLNKASLVHNYQFLKNLFDSHQVEWAPVLKMLCGNELFLEFVLSLGDEQVCDARLTNLKTIRKIKPEVGTIYIKPPSKHIIKDIVTFADVSFNTEFTTIKWLSEEAKRQNKVHRVVIMIELGDLREGIMGDHLMDFYKAIFELPNIQVAGIGTNLNCLSGVMPSKDKLIQLCLYEQLIEAKFDQKIDGVSGGSSVMVPLLLKGIVPKGINHFRVGETLFFGSDLFENTTIEGMKDDVFTLHCEIIEITEKPSVPYGELEKNPSGDMFEVDESKWTEIQKRAILDVGLLDVSKIDFLRCLDESVNFVGASSDMLVLDISQTEIDYKIGDIISFRTDYMGALRIMNSEYIEKRLI